MNKDIIVIPDVHGRTFWKEAVEKYPDADIIFLGDYLDPYPQEGIRERAALDNFKEILEYARSHGNVTLLFGNHDLVYWFPYNWGRKLTGWEDEILPMLRGNMDILHMFAVREINGKRWLFSHAPLFEEWIEYTHFPHDLKEIKDKVWKMLEEYDRFAEPKDYAKEREAHDALWRSLGRASSLRGGVDKCGSPVWADVREISDQCTLYKGADYYVFGHTQLEKPVITDTYACLDARQAFRITPEGKIEPVTEQTTPFPPKSEDFSLF